MPIRREKWTRLRVKCKVEAPRSSRAFELFFVSPGGLFFPGDLDLEPSTQVIARFAVEGRNVVTHAEVRRALARDEAGNRGIDPPMMGTEMRIVRMEGDGSVILAEHIKKILMESGGPTG